MSTSNLAHWHKTDGGPWRREDGVTLIVCGDTGWRAEGGPRDGAWNYYDGPSDFDRQHPMADAKKTKTRNRGKAGGVVRTDGDGQLRPGPFTIRGHHLRLLMCRTFIVGANENSQEAAELVGMIDDLGPLTDTNEAAQDILRLVVELESEVASQGILLEACLPFLRCWLDVVEDLDGDDDDPGTGGLARLIEALTVKADGGSL